MFHQDIQTLRSVVEKGRAADFVVVVVVFVVDRLRGVNGLT